MGKPSGMYTKQGDTDTGEEANSDKCSSLGRTQGFKLSEQNKIKQKTDTNI